MVNPILIHPIYFLLFKKTSFFKKEKINWMNQNGIDHSVMLCLSQLYCNGWKKNDAAPVACVCSEAVMWEAKQAF